MTLLEIIGGPDPVIWVVEIGKPSDTIVDGFTYECLDVPEAALRFETPEET